jgi:hypothetical protein
MKKSRLANFVATDSSSEIASTDPSIFNDDQLIRAYALSKRGNFRSTGSKKKNRRDWVDELPRDRIYLHWRISTSGRIIIFESMANRNQPLAVLINIKSDRIWQVCSNSLDLFEWTGGT